ncbi:alpha/beta hydrolase [Streptomyces sp. WMMC905]|uniref:alpha/beta hydrolase n=1 Tax=Streptomyces sp. WMMC905 TaxID=3404123 RepID=UPI003B9503F4
MTTPPGRPRGAVLLALAVALAATSLNGCGTPGDSSDAPEADDPVASAGLRDFYTQRLSWEPCGDEECSTLRVPMDYSTPGDGDTFTLPLIRTTATDRSDRVGSLVVNPGGPGESGVALLQDGGAQLFGERIRARFDIVGFDPRGVAGSEPAVDCGAEDEVGTVADDAPRPLHPATEEQRQAALAEAESTVRACEKHSGSILPHVGTLDAARDMDVLRAALGDEELTYLGWSYGTALGTSFGEQFPEKVRAMVLDGAVDPALGWAERAASQATGFRQAVDDYADYCAEVVGDSCPAETPDGIRALVQGLYESTAREPLPADGEYGEVDPQTLHNALVTSMYTPEDQWEPLSLALGEAATGDGTGLLEIALGEEDSAEAAHGFADRGTSRRQDAGRQDVTEEGRPDNSDVAITAVDCVDIPHPEDPREYWKALEEARLAEGDFGSESVLAALGCRGWPQRGPGPHRVVAEGLPPVLVVGTTGDPATPYHEAESLVRQLPQAMLLTFDALGHTAYGRGSGCVDDAVDDYLLDLKAVEPGKTC